MEMIVEYYPRVDLERHLFTAMTKRTDNDVTTTRGREDGQPVDNCRCDEMRCLGVVDAIATSHGSQDAETEFPRQVRSQTEFGNEEKGPGDVTSPPLLLCQQCFAGRSATPAALGADPAMSHPLAMFLADRAAAFAGLDAGA